MSTPTFGENVARCRKKAGLTQAELGRRCLMYRTEISAIERGRRQPRLKAVIKLSSALGVSLNELTEGLVQTPPRD